MHQQAPSIHSRIKLQTFDYRRSFKRQGQHFPITFFTIRHLNFLLFILIIFYQYTSIYTLSKSITINTLLPLIARDPSNNRQ